MSAVPGNFMDFGSWDTSNINGFDLPETQGTDYSVSPQSDGLPDNVVNTPRSDGITWTGVLSSVKSTATSLFDVFGKAYALNSEIENRKYQQEVQKAQGDLNRAATYGTLDIQRARIDANVAIEKARAARAVGDAQARVKSGTAGYIAMPSKMSPMLILGALAAIGVVLYFVKGK